MTNEVYQHFAIFLYMGTIIWFDRYVWDGEWTLSPSKNLKTLWK